MRLNVAIIVALTIAAAPVQARQILLVANLGNGNVGQYDATTGATINAAFVNGQTSDSNGLALDGNNHLFISNLNTNTVGLFNATTGATINSAFIQGFNSPEQPVLDGNNHLFIANLNGNTVGEYNAASGELSILPSSPGSMVP